MLTSTVVRLRTMSGGRLPLAMGEYGHAAFLRLINEVAPDLAQALHDAGTRQPFTVSPLHGRMRRRGQEWHVRTGTECWMRFTILDPALYTVFSRYFAEARTFDLKLNLGAADFVVEEVNTSPGQWSGYTTFARLLTEASEDPVIPVRFHSLTAFSLGDLDGIGPRTAMFPEAEFVFDSLLAKWNTFADEPLEPEPLRELLKAKCVLVKRYRLESQMWWFRRHPQPGFVGYCVYEVKGTTAEQCRYFNALADFAFYAGVGYHTTMGMGQCRRIADKKERR
jgi:CRISPR-associated endoribonuclease Cas6